MFYLLFLIWYLLINSISGVFKDHQRVRDYGQLTYKLGHIPSGHDYRKKGVFDKPWPKFSNLNCGEMVCNDVKYCLEKDADSYYGRAGSEPFNLKPPGPDTRKKMLTRQFHCQSVTVAREYFRVCPFFLFSFAFSLAATAT